MIFIKLVAVCGPPINAWRYKACSGCSAEQKEHLQLLHNYFCAKLPKRKTGHILCFILQSLIFDVIRLRLWILCYKDILIKIIQDNVVWHWVEAWSRTGAPRQREYNGSTFVAIRQLFLMIVFHWCLSECTIIHASWIHVLQHSAEGNWFNSWNLSQNSSWGGLNGGAQDATWMLIAQFSFILHIFFKPLSVALNSSFVGLSVVWMMITFAT